LKNEIDNNLGTVVSVSYQDVLNLGGIKKFTHIKAKENINVICGECKKSFLKKKDYAYTLFAGRPSISKNFFCSKECSSKFIYGENCLKKSVECNYCRTVFLKKQSEINKSKNNFCSSSCAGTYSNTHKTKGLRVSKLELYIQNKLKEKYPTIEILFNNKTVILSELDIYIPSLKIAFELNGIFHYEPIFGEKRLNQTKNNDSNKFQKCISSGISLCVIDTSSQKYFKEASSIKFLDIITKIIDEALINSDLN